MSEVTADLIITPLQDDKIVLQGEINRANVLDFVETLSANPIHPNTPLTIEVSELDIENGLTLLTLVNTFRALSSRVASLHIVGAPKALYNSLYSTGLLSGPHPIRLSQIRISDE